MAATEIHKGLPFVRFVRQTQTTPPEPLSITEATLRKAVTALQSAPWRKARAGGAVMMPPSDPFQTASNDAYDTYKFSGDVYTGGGVQSAFCGMAAYRFKLPRDIFHVTDPKWATVNGLKLRAYLDKFNASGLLLTAFVASDSTPNPDWTWDTLRGSAAIPDNVDYPMLGTTGISSGPIEPIVDAGETTARNRGDEITFTFPAGSTITTGTGDTYSDRYLWVIVQLDNWAMIKFEYWIEGGGMIDGSSLEVTFNRATEADPPNQTYEYDVEAADVVMSSSSTPASGLCTEQPRIFPLDHMGTVTNPVELGAGNSVALPAIPDLSSGGVVAIAAASNYGIVACSDGTIKITGMDVASNLAIRPPTTLAYATALDITPNEMCAALTEDNTIVLWGQRYLDFTRMDQTITMDSGVTATSIAIGSKTLAVLANTAEVTGMLLIYAYDAVSTKTYVKLAAGYVAGVDASTSFKSVAVVGDSIVAVTAAGVIKAWNPANTAAGLRTVTGAPATAVSVVPVKGTQSCLFLDAEGTVYCGYFSSHGGPAFHIPAGTTAKTAVAACAGRAVALAADGTAVSWDALGEPLTVPADVTGLASISVGFTTEFATEDHYVSRTDGTYVLGIRSNGSLVAWGDNYNNQATVPAGAQDIVDAAFTESGGVMLDRSGHSTFFGIDSALDTKPFVVSGPSGVKAVAAGGNLAAVLTATGTINARCPPSSGYTTLISQAAFQTGLNRETGACGSGRAIMLLDTDGIMTWAAGADAVPVTASGPYKAVACGDNHALALRTTGAVDVWGSVARGQAAVPYEATTGVIGIAAGRDNSMALKSDGSVVTWGGDSNKVHLLDGTKPVTLTRTWGVVGTAEAADVDTVAAGYGNGILLRISKVRGNSTYTAHRSTDLGVTWTQVKDSFVGAPLRMAYGNGIFMVVGGGINVARCVADTAETWTDVAAPVEMNTATAIAFGGGVFVVATASTGLWWSADYGDTWTQSNMRGGGRTVNAIAYGNSTFLAADGTGLWRSTDLGKTWVAVNDLGFSRLCFGNGVFLASTTLATPYVYFGNVATGASEYAASKLYRSGDSGMTWTEVNADLNFIALTHTSTHFLGLATKPSSGTPAYKLLQASMDGVAWTELSAGSDGNFPARGLNSIYAGPDVALIPALGGGQGDYKMLRDYIKATDNLALVANSRSDFGSMAEHNGILVGCTNTGFLFYSSTATNTSVWTQATQPSGSNSVRVVNYCRDKFYAVGGTGRVLVSSDGQTWVDDDGSAALTGITLQFVQAIGDYIFVGGTTTGTGLRLARKHWVNNVLVTNWTTCAGSGIQDLVIHNVVAFNNSFYAVTSAGIFAVTDGETMAAVAADSMSAYSAYVSGIFMVIGGGTGAGVRYTKTTGGWFETSLTDGGPYRILELAGNVYAVAGNSAVYKVVLDTSSISLVPLSQTLPTAASTRACFYLNHEVWSGLNAATVVAVGSHRAYISATGLPSALDPWSTDIFNSISGFPTLKITGSSSGALAFTYDVGWKEVQIHTPPSVLRTALQVEDLDVARQLVLRRGARFPTSLRTLPSTGRDSGTFRVVSGNSGLDVSCAVIGLTYLFSTRGEPPNKIHFSLPPPPEGTTGTNVFWIAFLKDKNTVPMNPALTTENWLKLWTHAIPTGYEELASGFIQHSGFVNSIVLPMKDPGRAGTLWMVLMPVSPASAQVDASWSMVQDDFRAARVFMLREGS